MQSRNFCLKQYVRKNRKSGRRIKKKSGIMQLQTIQETNERYLRAFNEVMYNLPENSDLKADIFIKLFDNKNFNIDKIQFTRRGKSPREPQTDSFEIWVVLIKEEKIEQNYSRIKTSLLC